MSRPKIFHRKNSGTIYQLNRNRRADKEVKGDDVGAFDFEVRQGVAAHATDDQHADDRAPRQDGAVFDRIGVVAALKGHDEIVKARFSRYRKGILCDLLTSLDRIQEENDNRTKREGSQQEQDDVVECRRFLAAGTEKPHISQPRRRKTTKIATMQAVISAIVTPMDVA